MFPQAIRNQAAIFKCRESQDPGQTIWKRGTSGARFIKPNYADAIERGRVTVSYCELICDAFVYNFNSLF